VMERWRGGVTGDLSWEKSVCSCDDFLGTCRQLEVRTYGCYEAAFALFDICTYGVSPSLNIEPAYCIVTIH